MSVPIDAGKPSASSGAMYEGVPMTAPSAVTSGDGLGVTAARGAALPCDGSTRVTSGEALARTVPDALAEARAGAAVVVDVRVGASLEAETSRAASHSERG